MKLITPAAHRLLDFAAVVVFAVAPFAFGLGGLPAAICWALAIVHLLVTLATRFPGRSGGIALVAHGVLELVVAIFLVAASWLFGFAPGSPARYFFVTAGVALFLVWLLTDYTGRGVERV
ncbi:MAG TPA: hypothetical protein VKH46_08550 [Thermoanaerobaculia bacterium]|jgi:hypothetical protein|nr:hypothetical protein [Thermoanaerobaculia bacterium]